MNKHAFPFDINCDLGEGLPNDAALMPLLDSCNIACGGHTGDEKSVFAAIDLAIEYGVKVGAHPSYPDRENFGRKYMAMEPNLLKTVVLKQIQFFERICNQRGIPLHHVKLHGALYNFAANDELTAFTIINIMKENFDEAYLYCPFGSLLSEMATSLDIRTKRELFADRNYNDDLSLVDRSHPQALMTNAAEVTRHVGFMIKEKKIKTLSGKMVPIESETICVHGDNPEALRILQQIRNNFAT